MPAPDETMWIKIEEDFCSKLNFPNVLGAIDDKHVLIQAPALSGLQFFCYKKTFNIVVLCLVDANYIFIAVDIGAYGKNTDDNIFNSSKLGKRLSINTLHVPPSKHMPGSDKFLPHVILGDEAFSLRIYLMRPYSRDEGPR